MTTTTTTTTTAAPSRRAIRIAAEACTAIVAGLSGGYTVVDGRDGYPVEGRTLDHDRAVALA